MNEYIEYIKNELKSKKVCIFPMGAVAKVMADELIEKGIKIDLFSDNNQNLWGRGVQRDKMCATKKNCLTLMKMS